MRKKDENIFYLLSLAPWWIGVCIAAIVYVTLKFVIPSVQFENPFFKGMAPIAPQFSWMAILFLLPAGISVLESFRKRKLLDRQSGIESVRKLSWKEFEELVAEAYRRQGYKVQENHSTGPDGGIDLEISKYGSRYLVQCKHWRNGKVGVKIAREMFGIMTADGADGVIIITSGNFTQEAMIFASSKPIDLVDGRQLLELVRNTQIEHERMEQPRAAFPAKCCPRCGNELVIRQAKKGPHAGEDFWGCSRYPNCRYIENMEKIGGESHRC